MMLRSATATTAASPPDGRLLSSSTAPRSAPWVRSTPPSVARLGLSGPVAAMEVNLSRLLDATRKERRAVTPSRYPASSIDLAFVVDESVPAGAAQRTLGAAAGDLLEDVRLFDVFRSDALGPNKKSLAFGLRFRAPDRTLTDEEVGKLRKRCIDAMAKEHGASLRG